MAGCKVIRGKKLKVCIGAMRNTIEIKVRTIKPPSLSSVDYDLDFTDIISVRAFIETLPRISQFDDVNIERTASHDMWIRFIPGIEITAESWIKFNGDFYDIIFTENVDEGDEWIRLRCNLRGLDSKQANFR